MEHFQGRENGGNVDFWFGVVEDRDDPMALGRVRVRIFGMHTDDQQKIPTASLPWSFVMLPATEAAVSGIGRSPTGMVTGTHVVGFFLDGGSAQYPFVIGSIGGAEIGDKQTCDSNKGGFESFTHGMALPVSFSSFAQDVTKAFSPQNTAPTWMTTAGQESASSEPDQTKREKYLNETNSNPSTIDDNPESAAFTKWSLQQNGIQPPNGDDGKNFQYWGTRTNDPQYGSIAVLQGGKSDDARTVGFFTGTGPDGRVGVIHPDQTGNVANRMYETKDVICYTNPPGFCSDNYGVLAASLPSEGASIPVFNATPQVPDKGSTNVDPNNNKVGPIREYIRKHSDQNFTMCTIHCTATPKGRDFSAADIDRMHKQRGFDGIGYHFIIRLNGTIEKGRPLDKTGAHVQNYNRNNIGVSLVGGVDSSNRPIEGFHQYTQAQVSSLDFLMHEIVSQWPNIKILGHRDFPNVAKACPCFDVRNDYLASRGKFFANTMAAPKFAEMGSDERKEAQSLKKNTNDGGDAGRDSSEVEPTQANMKMFGFEGLFRAAAVGFKDPNGMYPSIMSTCFNGGSNMNPLAQGASYVGTPLFKSDNQRVRSVPMAPKGNQEVISGNAKADGPVGPLDQQQVKQLMDALGKRESQNDYTRVNQLGYSGKYQFGALALTDLGYVKRGTNNKGLANPHNWTGKDSVSSRDDFLKNTDVQEKAMNQNMKLNYSRLLRFRVVNERSAAKDVAGYLAVSHLLGVGGARKLAQGRDGQDANGTSGGSYFTLGSNAVSETKGGTSSAGGSSAPAGTDSKTTTTTSPPNPSDTPTPMPTSDPINV